MIALGTGLPSLNVVVASLTSELDQIESVFVASGHLNTVDQYSIVYAPAEDGCLVSLWDAWNRFVRGLLLACCGGGVEGLSGSPYHPAVSRNEAEALAHINANRSGTNIKCVRGQPSWYDVTAIADLTALLGLVNAAQIVAAITATNIQLGIVTVPNPLEEIRRCRNFVAHKNPVTLGDVQGYTGAHLVNLRTHVRSKRFGVELFSDWKEGCLSIAAAAAQ